MTKKIILNRDNLEYHIKEKNDLYHLKYSKSGIWTDKVKGKTAIKAKDTGNGIKLKLADKELYLDYEEAEYIKKALNHLIEDKKEIVIKEK